MFYKESRRTFLRISGHLLKHFSSKMHEEIRSLSHRRTENQTASSLINNPGIFYYHTWLFWWTYTSQTTSLLGSLISATCQRQMNHEKKLQNHVCYLLTSTICDENPVWDISRPKDISFLLVPKNTRKAVKASLRKNSRMPHE